MRSKAIHRPDVYAIWQFAFDGVFHTYAHRQTMSYLYAMQRRRNDPGQIFTQITLNFKTPRK